MPPVDSHRVDLHDDERDAYGHYPDKKEGRQHSAGQYYPMPYGFCPPQFWQPWPQAVPGMADGRAGQMMSMPQQYYQPQMAAGPPPPPPQPQPQFLAVNVHTDNHQHQSQKADARAVAKQHSVKEKIVKNITRGVEQLLDPRVLVAGLAAFVLPRIAQHLQLQQQRRKKRELFFRFGFA